MQTVEGTVVFPVDYFSPMDVETKELIVTENTYTIHHFMGSWLPPDRKFVIFVQKAFGNRVASFCVRVKRFFVKR